MLGFELYIPQYFLRSKRGELSIHYEMADFCRVYPCIFAECSADSIADVIVLVLGAMDAEGLEQIPVRVVAVLKLEYDHTSPYPDIRIAYPSCDLIPESGDPPGEVAKNARCDGIDCVFPWASFYERF